MFSVIFHLCYFSSYQFLVAFPLCDVYTRGDSDVILSTMVTAAMWRVYHVVALRRHELLTLPNFCECVE